MLVIVMLSQGKYSSSPRLDCSILQICMGKRACMIIIIWLHLFRRLSLGVGGGGGPYIIQWNLQ